MWTLNDIEDLSGKIAIVTGGNSGLGYQTVTELARNNATVILCSRSIENGNIAKNEILEKIGDKKIIVEQLDLADLNSVTEFSNRFRHTFGQLDILVNNAGIMASPFGLTKNHFEQQIGVNHLGHFALTADLFELLRNTKDSRIVNVSSLAHRNGDIDFKDLFFKKRKYKAWAAYSQSKLANLLFTYELKNKCEEYNTGITVVAAHPGVSATNLDRYMSTNKLVSAAVKAITQPASMGVLPIIYAATYKGVINGSYYGPDGFREMRGHPTLVSSSKKSYNKTSMKRLFDLSEKLCDVKFDFNQD